MRAPKCLLASLLAVIPLACGDSDTIEPPPDPPRPTTITVIPAAIELTALGDTVRLRAEVRDQSGDLMGGVAVTWLSSRTTIATVSGSGLVTAVRDGTATITATAGTVSGSAMLKVRQLVRSMAVLPAADTLILGDSLRLEAEGFDATGHPVADAQFRWWSENPQVATVDTAGVVRAVSEGVAEIHATTAQTQGVAQITVYSPDRAALVALYHATNGPNWANNDNWLTDMPLWSWHGVGTNTDGRVTSVSLVGHYDSQSRQWIRHGLKGAIPAEVGSLAELQILGLYGNELSGTIPASLGDLAKLEFLDLSGNELTGPIPPELGGLSNLKTFALHTNSLEGAIPPEFGNLTRLETLALYDNELSGTIPTALGDLAELRYLSLSQNNLTGPIPPELGGLAKLEGFWLNGNQLVGPIPAALGDLAELRNLYLYDNNLTGPIPPELGLYDPMLSKAVRR